jgi:hypothetical protein
MNIQVLASEVVRHASRPWGELNVQERCNTVSTILRHRTHDQNAQRLAWYVETNNPNFKDFTIVDDLSRSR